MRVDGFIVLYRCYDDDDDYKREMVSGSESRHVMLRRLDADTAYSIVIRSFNRHGESELSNTVVMKTLASAATRHLVGLCYCHRRHIIIFVRQRALLNS